MSDEIEFQSVDRISVGTIGEPGERIFLLQVSSGEVMRSWTLEKEHVLALGAGSYALMAQIGMEEVTREMLGRGSLQGDPQAEAQAALVPDLPAYRIDGGSIVVAFNEDRQMIEISFNELVGEDERPASSARIWITRKQFAALGVQAQVVASRGRPSCSRCGQVLDGPEEEHRCPPHVGNGHYPQRS